MKELFNDSDWDRLIKERFTEHKVEPSEKTWQGLHIYVENMLAGKRKKRAAWLRLLSILLLLALLSFGVYELTRDKNKAIADNTKTILPTIQPKSNKKTEKQIDLIINNIPGKTQKDSIKQNSSSPSAFYKEKINEQVNQQQHENPYTNTSPTNTPLGNKSVTNSPQANKMEEQKKNGGGNSDSETTISASTEDAPVKNSIAYQKTASGESIPNKEFKKTEDLTNNIAAIEQLKTNNQGLNIESKTGNGAIDSSASSMVTVENDQVKNDNEISTDNQIEKTAVFISGMDSLIRELKDSVLVDENKIQPTDSLSGSKKTPNQNEVTSEIKAGFFSRFSVEATFSPEYAGRILTNANNGIGNTAEYYNNKEKLDQPIYTAHLKIGYSLTDRWKVKLGIGYNYFSQKSNLISDTLGSLQFDSHTCIIQTSAGRINFSSSLFHPFINHPEKTPINYRTSEKYEYLAIPLLFQYKLKENRTSWNVVAGVSANVLIKSTLRLDINDNNTVIFNHINGLQKTYFNFVFGIAIERDLWKRCYFSLMPLLEGAFTPINEGGTVKTYPYYTGLQLGLGYRFKKKLIFNPTFSP
ncbi:MAG: outer membrane beta-barrel protein [Bacteroidia bacterium]